MVPYEVASEVEGDRSSALKLEMVIVLECLDDSLRLLADNSEVVDIYADILVVVVDESHPNVGFGLGGFESNVLEMGSKLVVPSDAARL